MLSAQAGSNKSIDAEFARVYDAQKTVVTLVKSTTFRDTGEKKDECFDKTVLKLRRPHEFTAPAEEKCPIKKVLGIFLETFVKIIV